MKELDQAVGDVAPDTEREEASPGRLATTSEMTDSHVPDAGTEG